MSEDAVTEEVSAGVACTLDQLRAVLQVSTAEHLPAKTLTFSQAQTTKRIQMAGSEQDRK